MGKNNSAPQAPDTSAISNAQGANAATDNAHAQEQLDWARAQGVKDQATTDDAVKDSLTQQDTLNANSGADRALYNSTAPGALQTLQTDANNYSNPGFKDQQVGAARGAVATAADAARNNATQQLESFGVNPASTRFGALDIGTRVQQAADEAAAGTNAGNNTDATARALQQQVFADASPLADRATNESTAGTNTGATAVNEGNSTTSTGAATQGTGTQYAALGNAALTGQGQTVDNGYNNQLNQFKADQTASSGIGSALGAIGGIGLGIAGLGTGGGATLGGAAIKSMFSATGGAVGDPNATPGGAVPAHASPTGGQGTDDVPARLTVGEFVMPKDVVAWKGQEHFQKLIDKSREQAAQATAKPAVGAAPPQRPTFSSTPQGAIPARRAA